MDGWMDGWMDGDNILFVIFEALITALNTS